MDPLKLHVEVNGSKFDGEGPADIIKKAYDDWLAKVNSSPVAAATKAPDPDASKLGLNKANPLPGEMAELYKRVFIERDGLIILQVLPANKDDALLLLMHGYQKLKPDEYPVTAVRLMQVANVSGVNIERLDRALATKSEVLLKAGFKRSTRYSLNIRGEQEAINLMKTLFA